MSQSEADRKIDNGFLEVVVLIDTLKEAMVRSEDAMVNQAD